MNTNINMDMDIEVSDNENDRLQNLLNIKKIITQTLHECQPQLNAILQSENINIQDIIDMSRRIRLTIRAPPLWQPGYPLDNSFGHGPVFQIEELTGSLLRKYQILYGKPKEIHTQANKESLDESIITDDSLLAEAFESLGMKIPARKEKSSPRKLNILNSIESIEKKSSYPSIIPNAIPLVSTKEVVENILYESSKNESLSIQTVLEDSTQNVTNVETDIESTRIRSIDESTTKRARFINLSFGLSSSESESD